jgi:signal transduction histidine kinase
MAVQRLGLTVTSSMAIVDDPPPEIVAAAVSATREALNNVLKHAQTLDGAKLYVEATQKDLRICVRDRGVGLGSRLAPTTGGLVRSTAAFLRLGGECTLLPGVGGGTQVTLRWLAADPGEKGSLRVLFDQPRVPDSRTNGEELGVSTDNATVR